MSRARYDCPDGYGWAPCDGSASCLATDPMQKELNLDISADDRIDKFACSFTASFDEYRNSAAKLLQFVNSTRVNSMCDILESAYHHNSTVFVCGNGGSAANANHFAVDLGRLCLDPASGIRLRTLPLTAESALITAIANDDGYERVFEVQLAVHASPGDVLVCI